MTHNAFISRQQAAPTGSGKLDGISVAVKDNISTAGIETTCGSAMLEGYVPPYDATVIERIKEAGGTVTGKTNMDEFGMGTTTETSAFGPTENPNAPGRVPGGSSGGSAAAVASGDVRIALGSDTGGSIRCPAAYCGVYGLKPTYGRVSRYGLVAYANSLEQIGPMAADIEGLATLFEVICGRDTRDATTVDPPEAVSDSSTVTGELDSPTIGIPTELLEGVDEPVATAFDEAMTHLEAVGATVTEVSLPALEVAVQAYYVIAMCEASSNLARYDGVRYGHAGDETGDWNSVFADRRSVGFGEEVKRRILLGTFALSAGYQERYYKQAQDARRWLIASFDALFDEVDLLASPTMPTEPFPLGETIDDPMKLYKADRNTVPVNLANLPAISVPTESPRGLPVGIQLIAPAFSEDHLIRVASTF